MVSDSANSSTEAGNTIQPPKQIYPAVRWCLTLNNYTKEEISAIVPIVQEYCKCAILAYEVGEVGGTPHVQGYVEFKEKRRPMGLFECKRIHWEKANGNKQQNDDYCSKQGKVFLRFGFPKPIKLITELRPFQQEILDICMNDPDDRSIHWYWDEAGNIGKTQFMKYMCVKHKALPCVGGKFGDIMNLVFNHDMDATNTVIFNVPRGHREKMSYSSLEAIKDGMIVNTKYETGYKIFNSPHIIVFANFPPDENQLSLDRWVVKNVGIDC